MIILNFISLILGFVALIKGSDYFVEGSSKIAKILGVSSLIIGLTIVAFGTSAPEAAVSFIASINKSNGIALGNVIGSNLFNTLIVLGISSFFAPLTIDKKLLKREYPIALIGSCIIFFFSTSYLLFKETSLKFDENIGTISRTTGIILVGIFVIYMFFLVKYARREDNNTDKNNKKDLFKVLLLTIAGLLLIIIGGKITVDSAKYIAKFFGMSEQLIGLTIVAIGTSLPELVTSVVASKKRELGIAVGNVIGSNIFNLLFITGISSIINPLGVTKASSFDILILILVTIIAIIFSKTKGNIGKKEGVIMVLLYIAEVIFALIR